MSKAVEQAIRDFANGFLVHPDNEELRQSIADGKLKPETYYQHLLRLIYRLLFLLVIEERDLVFPISASTQQRDIYRSYYSLERLRLLSEKRHLADKRHHDLWLAMLATFRLFEAHGPGHKIGLAPLAGDLFSPAAIGPLASAMLGNDVLLGCLRALGLYQHPDNGQTIRVNYAALNVEEFGSVYEGLLEYEPVFLGVSPRPQAGEGLGERVNADHLTVRGELVEPPATQLEPFDKLRANGILIKPTILGERVGTIEFAFAQGDQRAATGSHYTPDDLVQPLIKHSLDYLIADALKKTDPAKVLLDLRVADISCGSGHILLAAARRIATELAIVRTGEEQPSPSAFRSAIRDVIRNCIYGVDLNPLAVELCKVALWLEAHSPGEPLNFLDHHIKCGNAIVGFARREEAERGVPDEAFATMPGDDKDTAALLRKRNKQERKDHEAGQLPLSPSLQKQLDDILRGWHELATLPEHTPDEIEAKKARYLALSQSQDAWFLNQIAAIPIAQFYLPKAADNLQKFVTDATYRRYWKGEVSPQGQATAEAWAMAERKHFFHWFLEFPEIIGRGGFDCILGNPPYLGGSSLSNTYGYPFCQYVKWGYAPAGLCDLVVYFIRRIFALLRPAGFMAFITTNSIKDGDNRRDGLDQILLQQGTINFAVRTIKWPGKANLTVSLVAIHRGQWTGDKVLDNQKVAAISSYFEDSIDAGDPCPLNENLRRTFEGSKFLGEGFLLTHEEATQMKSLNNTLQEVIFPVINGDEVNNHPEHIPGRSIINFFDWTLERAQSYGSAYQRVHDLVKPVRDKDKRPVRRERWWQYAERASGLYSRIDGLCRVFATSGTSKHLSFTALPTGYVYTQSLKILTSDRWDVFAVIHCTLHEVWARKYSGSLETRLSYSLRNCFETFPFPNDLWFTSDPKLAAIGEYYYESRGTVMMQLWLGLTDIYNLFHTRDLTPAQVAKVSKKSVEEAEAGYQGILELRRLHRELDIAIRDAYGWSDLNLGHDFIEVETLPENDRVRYTISPAARKEVLKRLLAENHRRAAVQAVTSPEKPKAKRSRKSAADDVHGDLFI
ncbi:Eco57I restriction-modification methylase domain-containing protein [Candidatus Nitrotoga sp. 1052]|uniref:Eco57I restriction-modification methylase domain-containing protein n=1 Tax=Candidatus Nitrotoga sp. 1052 TaxID=2886964 RepID=UPI001EF53E39|nr:DNA methyltransferase [Candidatus Nitrotoga sp. 1052]CAH1073341.1 Restriction endonuclease [Candidatus Nitrotoga sp. 1052]